MYQQGSETVLLSHLVLCYEAVHYTRSTYSKLKYHHNTLKLMLSPLPFSLLSDQEEGPIAVIVNTLLQMLEKDVIDNSKTCAEYFDFFKNYADLVSV